MAGHGPVTDPGGWALGPAGHALDGIYAAGDAAAFWTADGYPGPDATLGIGITTGYRAACAITRSTAPVQAGWSTSFTTTQSPEVCRQCHGNVRGSPGRDSVPHSR